MWIVNGTRHSKYSITHSKPLFILILHGLIFTFLDSYWSAFTFFIKNTDSKNMPTSHFAIHIMKVPKWSTMRVRDVAVKSAVYSTIPIMNVLRSLLSAFMITIAWPCRHHECGMLNWKYVQPFTIHIHDGSCKFQMDSVLSAEELQKPVDIERDSHKFFK